MPQNHEINCDTVIQSCLDSLAQSLSPLRLPEKQARRQDGKTEGRGLKGTAKVNLGFCLVLAWFHRATNKKTWDSCLGWLERGSPQGNQRFGVSISGS